MKKTLLTLALIALTATGALAQSAKPADEKIVARVNGETITADYLDYLWNELPAESRQNYDINGGGKLGFLDNYIERRLIYQQAVKEKFDQRDDVRHELHRTMEWVVINMYVQKVVAQDVVPEAELRDYYNKNRREFSRPPRAKVRQIMVTPGPAPVVNSANDDAGTEEAAIKKMEMIAKLLKDPKADFSDLAVKYSEDLSSKSGGDLGWVPQGKLSGPLDDALFKLKPGETSGMIKTEFGYHIIRCEAMEPAGFVPFEEAREGIFEKMLKERQTEMISVGTAFTKDLRRASAVTVYRENL